MRPCHHCARFFRSKQAVRAHLMHCAAWLATGRARQPQEPLYQCAVCRNAHGPELTEQLTVAQMHTIFRCQTCGHGEFVRSGWRIVPTST